MFLNLDIIYYSEILFEKYDTKRCYFLSVRIS